MDTVSEARRVFESQKVCHRTIRLTRSLERLGKLTRLRSAIERHTPAIKAAIYADFKKNPAEVDITEIFTTLSDLNHTIKNLRKWMKAQRVSTPLAMFGSTNRVMAEPKGVCLIISPWNYPFSLLMGPLIAAVAAGNCAVLKPSELTPHTSRALKMLLAEVFDEREVSVFEGDASVTQVLLTLKFDHIFFTGSPRVGKIVMQAASQSLASVTLELGGKSPAIIDESADVKQSAERLIWGKFINAGQSCIAPDYVWISEKLLPTFIAHSKAVIERFYGPSEEARKKSKDLCRIINLEHFNRIKNLTTQSVAEGAKIEIGGIFDSQERYVSPTLLTGVSMKSAIMQEEIFGPVLPILSYRTLDEVYSSLDSQEKPLALYIFSRNSSQIDRLLARTTAGGTCINNTMVHFGNPHLPFGGTGQSGMGSYHGVYGFKAFSHERAVLKQSRLNSTRMMFPPYTSAVEGMIRLTLKFFS